MNARGLECFNTCHVFGLDVICIRCVLSTKMVHACGYSISRKEKSEMSMSLSVNEMNVGLSGAIDGRDKTVRRFGASVPEDISL